MNMKVVLVGKALLMAAVTTVWTSAWSANCYWTGGGDGVNWSDAANWSTPPRSGVGDILWFTNSVSVVNDISDDFVPKTLKFHADGPVKVSGKRIAFTSGGTGIDSGRCYVEMNAPIKISNNNNQFDHVMRFDYNGLVTVEGAKTLLLNSPAAADPESKGTMPEVRINGGITATSGTVEFRLGRNQGSAIRPFWINSALNVKSLVMTYNSYNKLCYVTVGGQKWQTAAVGYGSLAAAAENVFATNAVISMSSVNYGSSSWNLNGYNQTIDRIYSSSFPTNKADGKIMSSDITSTHPATLTMRATKDGRCWERIAGRVSVVWAPTGPYAIDFLNRDHTTSGDLFVSNGTMSVSGTATFKNVGEIRVGDGALFDLATTAANALTGTRNLLVEGTGVFRVAATAATPFSSVRVRLGSAAKLSVPAGVTLTVGALTVGGEAVADDTYTGEGWIDGEGSVKVDSTTLAAASWKAPVSGDWSEAAKWQGGTVPSGTDVAIDAAGADYTVTAADGTTHAAAIAIGGGVFDGTATLKPAGTFTQTAGTLAVNPGGCLELGSGANYVFTSDTTWRDPTVVFKVAGGTVALDGGSLTASPFYGRMTIAGSGRSNGKVTVRNGTFSVRPWQSDIDSKNMQSLRVLWGGCIEVGDDGVFEPKAYGWGATPLTLEGGSVLVAGSNGLWRATAGQTERYMGYGAVTFSGGARLVGTGALGLEASADCLDYVWTFKDRARIEMGTGTFRISDGKYNTTQTADVALTLDSDAAHVMGATLIVGSRRGNGVLNIRRGRVDVGADKLGVGVMGYSADNVNFAPTGTVNMTGGTLIVSGGNIQAGSQIILGLEIGSPINTGSTLPRGSGCGTFNLAGGVVTNQAGHVVLGAAGGVGTFNQEGGSFVGRFNTRGGTSFEGNLVVLGLLNGRGTWKMTGGSATFSPSVFVGGCDMTRLHNSLALNGRTEKSQAKGLLSVAGGTFATERSLVLGERGTGTLEIGPGGTVSAGSFAVSNEASTVTIKLGADGGGNLAIAGDLAVEAGAKLVIDASAVDPENLVRGVNVVTYGTASRPYADADVTFIGDARGVLRFRKTAKGYRIPGTRGMAIIFR